MKKFLLLCFFSFEAFAVKEYYALSRSIRSLGMGGAFYGLSNDEYALFYNPAGLSLYNGDSEGMLRINTQMSANFPSALGTFTRGPSSPSSIINSLNEYQGKPIYGAAGLLPYYLRKNFAIGLLIADSKINFGLLGREIDTEVDMTVISDTGLVIGYARSIGDPNLHIGLNTKLLARAGGKKKLTVLEIAQNENLDFDPKNLGGIGGGVDFDLGATYDFPTFPFGLVNRVSLVFNNLAASTFSIGRTGQNIPTLSRTMSLAYYTVFPGWKFIDNFHVLVDLAEFNLGGESDPDYGQRSGFILKHLNLGVEMPIRWFTLRTGFHQGYLSAGFGINAKFFRMDFATYAEELAGAPGRLGGRRFALTLAFGSGSSAPAPYKAEREAEVTEAHSRPSKVEPKVDPSLDIETTEKPKVETPQPENP